MAKKNERLVVMRCIEDGGEDNTNEEDTSRSKLRVKWPRER
jgi:hypothetical protein